MSLVIDASATLAWYFEDESNDTSDALLERVAQNGAVVPTLWRYEVVNGFQMAVRRKRIGPSYRDASLSELRLMPITIDRSGDHLIWTAALALADRFELTVYDAAYVELAQRRSLPLATGDRPMRKAARALSIEVVDAG